MDDSGPPRSSKADGVPGSVRSRRTRTRNAQQGKLYQDQSRGRVRDSRTRPLLLTSRPDDGPVGESGPGLVTLPPAASILLLADADTLSTATVTATERSPSPSTLTGWPLRTAPADTSSDTPTSP